MCGISIEIYRIYDFPGGVRTLYPSSGSAHAYDRFTCDIQFSNLEDRFSHATVHFSSDDSKHDEVHDSAIFYLVLH